MPSKKSLEKRVARHVVARSSGTDPNERRVKKTLMVRDHDDFSFLRDAFRMEVAQSKEDSA